MVTGRTARRSHSRKKGHAAVAAPQEAEGVGVYRAPAAEVPEVARGPQGRIQAGRSPIPGLGPDLPGPRRSRGLPRCAPCRAAAGGSACLKRRANLLSPWEWRSIASSPAPRRRGPFARASPAPGRSGPGGGPRRERGPAVRNPPGRRQAGRPSGGRPPAVRPGLAGRARASRRAGPGRASRRASAARAGDSRGHHHPECARRYPGAWRPAPRGVQREAILFGASCR